MQDRNNILHHFFLRGCGFIVYNGNLCPKPLKCAFKPVKAKTNEAVFVGDKDRVDLFNGLIDDHASCVGKLAEELDLIYQIVFLVP